MGEIHQLPERTSCAFGYMALTAILAMLVTMQLVTATAAATEDHVVGVRHAGIKWLPPGVKLQHQSGICIDVMCSVVATAYHGELLANGKLKLPATRVRKVVPYASERDDNKANVTIYGKQYSYNLAKDIAFLYAAKPLRDKAGVQYSFNCEVGQKVTIVGAHMFGIEKKAARIIGINVRLRVWDTKLTDNLVVDVGLKPGASGSAVFDSNGRLLGMIILYGTVETKRGPLNVSIALPVSIIAKALTALDPRLASTLFKDVPEDRPSRVSSTWIDMAPSDFEPDKLGEAHAAELNEVKLPLVADLLIAGSNVPEPVRKLQTKAEASSKLLADLIARECLLAEGKTRRCYEVSIVKGEQQYSEMDKNGKLGLPTTATFRTSRSPVSLWTESTWSDYLGSVADSPWTFVGAMGHKYVFSGKGGSEDDRCWFRESPASGAFLKLHHPGWEGPVACSELLLTNSEFDVLTMYTEFYPPPHCLIERMDTVIEYHWVRLADIDEPVLLPIKENLTARVRGRKNIMLAAVEWSEYRKFRADHKIRF